MATQNLGQTLVDTFGEGVVGSSVFEKQTLHAQAAQRELKVRANARRGRSLRRSRRDELESKLKF